MNKNIKDRLAVLAPLMAMTQGEGDYRDLAVLSEIQRRQQESAESATAAPLQREYLQAQIANLAGADKDRALRRQDLALRQWIAKQQAQRGLEQSQYYKDQTQLAREKLDLSKPYVEAQTRSLNALSAFRDLNAQEQAILLNWLQQRQGGGGPAGGLDPEQLNQLLQSNPDAQSELQGVDPRSVKRYNR